MGDTTHHHGETETADQHSGLVDLGDKDKEGEDPLAFLHFALALACVGIWVLEVAFLQILLFWFLGVFLGCLVMSP